MMYLISDIASFFIQWVPYRKKVIQENLSRCFPDFSIIEQKKIRKKFQKFLLRLVLESMKGFSLSNQEAAKRFHFVNPEVIEPFLQSGKSVIGMAGHFGNWEWGALGSGVHFSRVIGLYKPIKNHRIDQYVREKRSQHGLQLGSIQNTHRVFAQNQAEPTFFLLISDQQPSNREKSIWVNFFNTPTPCLHGAELYGSRYEMPVVFIDIIPKSKGFYEAVLIVISENAALEKPGELTQKFMQLLEHRIQKNPEYWLWSHRRWKWNQMN